MVCQRCVLVVKQVMEKLNMQPSQVALGEVELEKPPTDRQLNQLNNELIPLGFELLDDQKKKQIESVKNLIIQKVQTGAANIIQRFYFIRGHKKARHNSDGP